MGRGNPPLFSMEKKKKTAEAFFLGIRGDGNEKYYPHWVYHKVHEPILVNDTSEEDASKLRGFEAVGPFILSNSSMQNWFWDLEDMSSKQLRVFAKDEFGVDLPEDARQEVLFSAVCKLSKAAPQNQGRIALMAHTIRMNYDETIEQIRRGIAGGVTETITEEFVA